MAAQGFGDPDITRLLFENPHAFYSQSERFKPQLDLPYIDPSQYQR
jgi:hypothetical protein